MKFKKEIIEAASKHDIPPEILASVVKIESNFDKEARRYEEFKDDKRIEEREAFKEASNYIDMPNKDDGKWEDDASYGLCQLMGTTAFWLGWRPEDSNQGFFELYDPQTNLDLGAEYLAHLYSKYPEISHSNKERWNFSIAAFNAGRGNINKALSIARAVESEMTGEQISIKSDGRWQTWEFTKEHLSKVTGERSKYTLRYIDKLRDGIGDIKEKLDQKSVDVPRSCWQTIKSVVGDISDLQNQIEEVDD